MQTIEYKNFKKVIIQCHKGIKITNLGIELRTLTGSSQNREIRRCIRLLGIQGFTNCSRLAHISLAQLTRTVLPLSTTINLDLGSTISAKVNAGTQAKLGRRRRGIKPQARNIFGQCLSTKKSCILQKNFKKVLDNRLKINNRIEFVEYQSGFCQFFSGFFFMFFENYHFFC